MRKRAGLRWAGLRWADHYLTNNYLTSISPVSRQYFTSISPVSHLYLTSISPVSHEYLTSISPVSHHYLTSISPVSHQYLNYPRPGAARVNGWTLLHSISPVSHLLLLPLFPAPLAQDFFIGAAPHLNDWHVRFVGIDLWVDCTSDGLVPRMSTTQVRLKNSACFSHVRSSISRRISPASHHAVSHQYLTSISQVYHQYSVSHQYLTSISPVSHQYLTSILKRAPGMEPLRVYVSQLGWKLQRRFRVDSQPKARHPKRDQFFTNMHIKSDIFGFPETRGFFRPRGHINMVQSRVRA